MQMYIYIRVYVDVHCPVFDCILCESSTLDHTGKLVSGIQSYVCHRLLLTELWKPVSQ